VRPAIPITTGHSNVDQLFTYCAITIVTLCFGFLILLWTQCLPAKEYWDLFDNNRHCIDEGPPLMAQIGATIATDILTYILPMPTLYRLNLPVGQRIGLMILFGFGGLVVVAGCLRMYYTHLTVYETWDVTWVGFHLWIWTAVEVNLGIICGCIPALKPLAFRAQSKLASYAKSSPLGSIFTGSGSQGRTRTQRSQPTDVELDDDSSIVDRFERRPTSMDDKLGDASFNDIEHCHTAFNVTKPLNQDTSWMDDADPSDETETWMGRSFSAADITRTSFGLKQ